MEACLDLDEGSFKRKTPGILVGLLSQSLDPLRKLASLFSTDKVIDRLEAHIHISCGNTLSVSYLN
jgi:hypothetical protein